VQAGKKVKRLAIGTVAVLVSALLGAGPATAATASTGPHAAPGANFGNGPGARKLEMAFFEQWGIYGRGFDLADADNEGEIADLTDIDYAFGGVEPLSGATHNSAGALAVPNEPIQENPAAPGYNPVVCSSLDIWADYQTPYLVPITGSNGQPEANVNSSTNLAGNFEQLAELKAKYPNLKVVMSLGGYNGSAFFSAAASTAAARQAFVSSCIQMYIEGDPGAAVGDTGMPVTGSETPFLPNGTTAGLFNGFDIDWEYPGNNNGAPGNLYSPADTEDLVLLMQDFRAQLDALSRSTGQQYTLTVEMPAGTQNAVDEDPAGLARYVNDEVVMDYDFQGPWDPTGPTNFDSNLYESPNAPDTTAEPLISVASTVSYYEHRGLPPSQLVVGLPYYGHGWTGVAPGSDFGLYQPATGPATSPDMTSQGAYLADLDGTDPAGTSDYYELAACPSQGVTSADPTNGCTAQDMSGFSWHFDPVTGATWLYNSTTGTFWSIEDPAEVYEKAQFVDSHGLAGASVWALEGDSQNALTSALTAGLEQSWPGNFGNFG
jgi:chitinase